MYVRLTNKKLGSFRSRRIIINVIPNLISRISRYLETCDKVGPTSTRTVRNVSIFFFFFSQRDSTPTASQSVFQKDFIHFLEPMFIHFTRLLLESKNALFCHLGKRKREHAKRNMQSKQSSKHISHTHSLSKRDIRP